MVLRIPTGCLKCTYVHLRQLFYIACKKRMTKIFSSVPFSSEEILALFILPRRSTDMRKAESNNAVCPAFYTRFLESSTMPFTTMSSPPFLSLEVLASYPPSP